MKAHSGIEAAPISPCSRLIHPGAIIAVLSAIFIVTLLIGFIAQQYHPIQEDQGAAQAKYAAIERLFGGFRAQVRDGEIGAMVACAGIILGFNLLGSVFRSVTSIFIIPALFSMWSTSIGRFLTTLHGSSSFSVVAFLVVLGLEWITYILSAAAGANIGLAFLFPRLKTGVGSRRQAAWLAVRESKRIYIIMGIILAVQAVTEILYVRAVLLHGGTGVPLLPY